MKYKSKIMAAIHETAKGLHDAGLISDADMQGFDKRCLKSPNDTDSLPIDSRVGRLPKMYRPPVKFHPSLHNALANPSRVSPAAIHAIKEVMERERLIQEQQSVLARPMTLPQKPKKKK